MEAAENERLYNQYQETQALNTRRQDEIERKNAEAQRLAAEKLEEEKRENLSREDVARRNVAVREAYQQMRALRDRNTHTFKTREDGMIVAINNMDPTKVVATGVKSNELSDLDKINLNLDADIALANRRGEIESGLIGQRGDEARQTAAERERLLQTRPPTTRSGGGSNNLEETRRVTNRLQQMGIERPDLFRYIQNGTIKSGTPDNIRAEINQYVYGETRTPALSNVPFNKSGGTTGQPVRMRTPDGSIRLIPADKVEEAKKRGAVEVK